MKQNVKFHCQTETHQKKVQKNSLSCSSFCHRSLHVIYLTLKLTFWSYSQQVPVEIIGSQARFNKNFTDDRLRF